MNSMAYWPRTILFPLRFPVWQWPVDRKDSPWYPAMTIHWQEFLGDWSTPVGLATMAIQEALA